MKQNEYVQTENSSIVKQTYNVKEIAIILGISDRTAYHICNTTKYFKVLKLGRTVRVHKDSFDNWFSANCI